MILLSLHSLCLGRNEALGRNVGRNKNIAPQTLRPNLICCFYYIFSYYLSFGAQCFINSVNTAGARTVYFFG